MHEREKPRQMEVLTDALMDCSAACLVKTIFPSVLIQFKFPGRDCINLSCQKRLVFGFQAPVKKLIPQP